jgi:hypothetical protein
VKGYLSGCSFADADQLLQTVLARLNGIEKATLQFFFGLSGDAPLNDTTNMIISQMKMK